MESTSPCNSLIGDSFELARLLIGLAQISLKNPVLNHFLGCGPCSNGMSSWDAILPGVADTRLWEVKTGFCQKRKETDNDCYPKNLDKLV